MAVFTLFFLFDFFRLSEEEDTWEAAVLLTMKLYLDYINFLLYALRLIATLSGGSSNKD
jgi:FtsH-binding integral membrane protein